MSVDMKNSQAVLLAARFRAEDELSLGRTVEVVANAARATHGILDRAIANLTAEIEAIGPVACRQGCNWCCHQHVAVLGAEALAIHLRIKGTPAEQRLRTLAPEINRLSARERRRAKIPCPFVDAKEGCTIYDVRPNRCRAVHSRDADYCFRRFDGVENEPVAVDKPIPVEPVEAGDAALAGLGQALNQYGIPTEPLEMVHALFLLTTDPEAGSAYAAGDDALAAARLPQALEHSSGSD
ncbi:YkgJ family cysteine cluster protein [Sphingomonas daechungensis]|uniref:YkgJ family cysteine cluster protein n=1 Tax=Sphingomonas daechungensis TaxID=1176646 RepID=UPI0037834E14